MKATEGLKEMQNLQQQLQMMLMQKQNISMQISEIKSALDEVKKTNNTELYEIVGTVMLERKKDELEKTLSEKQEILDLRINTLEKQIKKLTERSKEIQKDLIRGSEKK